MSSPLCIFHVDLNFVNIKPDYLRSWLHKLAEMGYNGILWELEDKVKWDTCPDAAAPDAMSKDEFRSILAEAGSLGLEPVPLLQTVGHAEYILMHDAYSHMRELPGRHDCYCTENPDTRRFLKQLISEYLDLFGDIRYFHLGGDEAYVFARCPVCSEETEHIGRNALYARHIMDIAAPVREQDARAGIWCDMVLNHPDQMDAIPSELVIWDWNYWDMDDPIEAVRVWGKGRVTREDLTDEILSRYPEITGPDSTLRGFYTSDALKRMGFDVFLCSAARSGGDSIFLPRTHKHARNISGAARKAAEAGLLGTCVTDWAIRINSWETHSILLPIAPIILKNPSLHADEALHTICSDLFGTDSALFIEAADTISETEFPFSRAHSTGIQWDGLKDSLPAPPDYIKQLLAEWKNSGRLDEEKDAIGTVISTIESSIEKLETFTAQAETGEELLKFWSQAAEFQLRQARMAREILNGNCTSDNGKALRKLKAEYEKFLCFDQTPASAAKNAGLVYDCLIEYVECGT